MRRHPLAQIVTIFASLALSFGTAIAARPDFVPASAHINGCSSTIISIQGKVAYGVSAAHCASGEGNTTSFALPSGKSGVARWVYIDREVDMSVFMCWSMDVDTAYSIKRKPKLEGYISCGYPKGKGPQIIACKFKGETILSNFDKPRWEFDVEGTRFNKGCSGSGVFSGDSLVGVVSHGSDDNDDMYSSTHSQLVSFIEKAEAKLQASLFEGGTEEKRGFVYEGIPLGSDVDRTKAIVHILAELKKRNAELEEIKRTPIRVQILDPKTGKVLQEQSYPFGTPIKLLLPSAR